MVDGFKTNVIADWAKRHLASGSAVISDGLACFKSGQEWPVSTWVLSPGATQFAGSSGIQLGKHTMIECEELAAGQLS